MKTYVLWTMEWPSWGWLIQGNGTAMRRPKDSDQLHVFTPNIQHGVTDRGYLPPEDKGDLVGTVTTEGGPMFSPLATATAFSHSLSRVPCLGSGPLNLDLANRAYRDCSQPDMAKAESLPWISRETAATAIAEMSAPDLRVVETRPQGSRLPGYISFGATGAGVLATAISFLRYNRYQQRTADHGWKGTQDLRLIERDAEHRAHWRNRLMISAAATFLVGGASPYLWNRHQANFSVAPSLGGYGGSASFVIPGSRGYGCDEFHEVPLRCSVVTLGG